MQKSTWTAPEFEEVNLGSEIGTYYEDQDEPSFLMRRPPLARRESRAVEPHPQQRGAAPRGD